MPMPRNTVGAGKNEGAKVIVSKWAVDASVCARIDPCVYIREPVTTVCT